MLVLLQLLAHVLKKQLIVHFAHRIARLVQYGNYALVRLLNQIAYDFIVEVLNVLPVDVLSLILFLLLFEDELNEKLLEFFVAVVDAKLLKSLINNKIIKQ
jgi:hypothetical protein